MYPAYNQFMDSYPSHQMNQNPFPYQSWPHSGYGYYPGYFAPPMMPPYAPAPPMYYGGYPAPPMPYHPMERPPCNSPRNMSESYGHCCGCPNHQQDHNRKDAKFEEERSDSVKKAGDSPVFWSPQGFLKNSADSPVVEGKRELPFPFIWMPYNLKDKSTEKKEKEKQETSAGEESHSKAPEKISAAKKVVPVKSVEELTDKRPKTCSRLPPVCLRVDPVNKKKNGKGSSRSPSPPGDKNKSPEPPQEPSSKAKTDEVSEGTATKDEAKDQNLPKSQAETTLISGDSRFPARRNLSEGEAATLIQAAYRGFEVRRWEPLKKLKQISEVRNEVVKLGNEISSDAVNDDKRRIAIDETIMNLLLKLDTIQGLHPSIRDVRKSVARELVSLQEKIDHLSQKKPEIVPGQESGVKLFNDRREVVPGMNEDDEKTGIASQQPVTESLEDKNDGGTGEKLADDQEGEMRELSEESTHEVHQEVAEEMTPDDGESPEGELEMEDGDRAPEVVELDVKDMKEEDLSPPSPDGDSVSAEFNKKLEEENEKLREMMQKLIETGNQQLSTISNLSGRVEDLEKKLRQKNRLKMKGKNHHASRKACRKSMNAMLPE